MLKLPIAGIQQGYYTCVAEQTRLESKIIIEKNNRKYFKLEFIHKFIN